MTASQNQSLSLDDVLAEISTSAAPPDARQFHGWVKRFPQFRSEIVDFVTDWIEIEAAKHSHEATKEDVDLVVNRTMSRIQQLLDEVEKTKSMTDLSADIKATGHDFNSFQRTVGIDRSILTCLMERMICPVTIPLRMVTTMAQTLNRDAGLVRDYLRLPPQQAAAYKARKQPTLNQVDFAVVVRDADIPEVEKERWLAEPPDPAFRE